MESAYIFPLPLLLCQIRPGQKLCLQKIMMDGLALLDADKALFTSPRIAHPLPGFNCKTSPCLFKEQMGYKYYNSISTQHSFHFHLTEHYIESMQTRGCAQCGQNDQRFPSFNTTETAASNVSILALSIGTHASKHFWARIRSHTQGSHSIGVVAIQDKKRAQC